MEREVLSVGKMISTLFDQHVMKSQAAKTMRHNSPAFRLFCEWFLMKIRLFCILLAQMCIYSHLVALATAGQANDREKTIIPLVETNPPSIGALLDRYAESQEVFRSFVIRFEESSRTTGLWKGTRHTTDHAETVNLCYDSWRAKLIKTQWGYVDAAFPNLPKEKARPQFWLWDGQIASTYVHNYLPGRAPQFQQTLGTSESEARWHLHWMYVKNFIPYINMHIPCDYTHDIDSIDQALRRAKQITLRPAREKVGGALCYVIEAALEPVKHRQLVRGATRGHARTDDEFVAAAKHTLWLDPEHDYHIAKGVSVYTKPLGQGTFFRQDTRGNVRFARMDGVWLPVEMDSTTEERGTANPAKVTVHYKVTEFMKNPDHEARRSFKTEEVTNGASVVVFEKGKIVSRGRWQNGQVAP